MGTWNTKINGNDTFQDVYKYFYYLYNQGQDPDEISKQVEEEFNDALDSHEDKNNSLFGLALAQWETQSLSPTVFNQVKNIIEEGKDIALWMELGADEKILKQRKKELEKFLKQISTEKGKPKRRIKVKSNYTQIPLLILPAPDGQKEFRIIENYINQEYVNTSSSMNWPNGGGSIFYFCTKGKFVTATWIDSQTLEIRHDKSIEFSMKNESFYLFGDHGVIKYVSE